jgi:DnaJ family protein C protein 8
MTEPTEAATANAIVTAAATTTTTESSQDEEWQVQRDYHKQLGDNAFRCQGFKTAIDEYTKAISLDPEFLVGYSNRSAAYLKNSEKSKALRDAEQCVTLDSQYAKGHSRLAAASHSLGRYSQALKSYQEVLKLDASNAAAQKGVDDCQQELQKMEQQQQEHYELFREREVQAKNEKEEAAPAKPKDDDDEDDDLNDFFDDVEEVVAKKKEKVEDPLPKATNAIKKQRESLGTSQDQMERLLQPNFEWRNLNPFYVLHLQSNASEEDISRRYKGLSLLLHPDKNSGTERAQLAYDQVQKAKNILSDPDRAKHSRLLMEEGMKQGKVLWQKSNKKETLQDFQEKECLRIFAMVEMKRREVEKRERSYEQRERKQEDDALEKERKSRQFDKKWRDEQRVDKRVGNWRDFATKKKKKET